jgi:Spy/CpxP family protein refolding chaperone
MLAPVLLAMLVFGATRSARAQKCGQPFEVEVGTPSKVIARTLVDQMFDEIVLTETQQAKAIEIVTKFIEDQAKLRGPDRQQKVDELSKKRNADLLALLTNDADKAKLSACFKKMEERRGGGRSGSLTP